MLLISLISKLDRILQILLATMMALLVIDVTWQVLTRFILPQPSSFTEEVARFLLIWISLIGGAYAYRLHSHLGFDLFVRNLPKKKAMFMYRICCVLVGIFALLVLIVGGSNLVHLTWSLGQFSPVLNLPMALIYSVLPISGILFLIYSVHFFIDANQHAPSLRAPEEDDLEQEQAND